MMPWAASLASHSKWVYRRCRIRRCCELSKSWELASCPSSVKESPQALRVPDTQGRPGWVRLRLVYGHGQRPSSECRQPSRDNLAEKTSNRHVEYLLSEASTFAESN